MFGKKQQDDDLTSLITGGKVKSKPASERIIANQPQKSVHALSEVDNYPSNVFEGAAALVNQLKDDSEKGHTLAPKDFFKKITGKHEKQVRTISAYLFFQWHHQLIDNGGKNLNQLVENSHKVVAYANSNDDAEILKEFAAYLNIALAVNFTLLITQNSPSERKPVQAKLLGFADACIKILCPNGLSKGGSQPKEAKTEQSQNGPLAWFNQVEINSPEFFALKIAANNFHEFDSHHGSKIYDNHLDQLGEIGKTPFGIAMFYSALGIVAVIREHGARTVHPIMSGYKVIADWIESQPNADELYAYMNVPFVIINAEQDKFTPALQEAFNESVAYIKAKMNKDKASNSSMKELMAQVQKLQEGIESMPGVDPKAIAELRELINKGKEIL